MARAPTMVIQEDYIDMDLTPTTPSSPRCGGGLLREFEFHSGKHSRAAFASPADELFYKGNLLPLHLPPRLQLVQKLLQEQQVEMKTAPDAAEVEDDVDVAKACAAAAAKKYSWSKRLKLMKRWTSREYIKSLFLARPGDIGIAGGNGGGGGGGDGGGRMDQEEVCGHRKSFSGIIRRVRLVVATKAAAAPGVSPLCSTSTSSSSTPSCGDASGFFRATTTAAALKRSSSAGSEEGAIQGAIAHCKRSHQQQQGRKSVSDVVFYSASNTPRVSSAAAASEAAAQELRQEMCRG